MNKNIMPYKNGVPHGYWESYSDNGQLIYKATYKNGDLHGSAEFYYTRTGTLQSKGTFKDDSKFGFWEWYNENEAPVITKFYANE